jgi:hypothetical protein
MPQADATAESGAPSRILRNSILGKDSGTELKLLFAARPFSWPVMGQP